MKKKQIVTVILQCWQGLKDLSTKKKNRIVPILLVL